MDRSARRGGVLLLSVCILLDAAWAACPFSGNISGTSEVRLDAGKGNAADVGLHASIVVHVELSNSVRFLECSVAARLAIPNGAHVDLDALRDDAKEYGWQPADPQSVGWDGERTAESSARAHLWLCSRKPLVNSFLFADTFRLPVNLRYHAAREGYGNVAEVKFMGPEVFVRCERDEITRWPECGRHMISAPCSCGGESDPMCGHVRVPKLGARALVLRVPVADLSHLWPSLAVTLIVVTLCLAYIAYYTVFAGGKGKAKGKKE